MAFSAVVFSFVAAMPYQHRQYVPLQVKVLGDQLHCCIHGAMLYHVVAHHLC